MTLAATYCPTRRLLERRSWNLVGALSSAAGRLVGSAGMDHRAYNETTAKCREIRALITAAHEKLRAHRSSHGC